MARQKPYRAERWGILNHVGGIWSPENFDTEAQAQTYLEQQRKSQTWGRINLSRHRVAKLRLTLSIPPSALTPPPATGSDEEVGA